MKIRRLSLEAKNRNVFVHWPSTDGTNGESLSEKILVQANGFLIALERLDENRSNGNGGFERPLLPLLTLGALVTELSFKALHACVYNEHSPARTHCLDSLFNSLPERIKDEVSTRLQDAYDRDLGDVITELKERLSDSKLRHIVDLPDAKSLVCKTKDYFSNARYSYESPELLYDYVDYPLLALARVAVACADYEIRRKGN